MSSALYYLTVFLVDPCFVDENLKWFPVRAIKAIRRKQGDVCTRVRNKTRIVIRPFRTHKPLLLKKPIRAACLVSFCEEANECGLLAPTKVTQEAIHIIIAKTSTGIRPWIWIHPVSEWLRGSKLAARLVDCKSFKMEITRWASKFYKFTLWRDFFTEVPQAIQSNHSVYNAPFSRR